MDRNMLPLGATGPGNNINDLGSMAEQYCRPIEGYVRLGTELIFMRVEPVARRAFIVLAEGPPPFGSPNYIGRKWRAA